MCTLTSPPVVITVHIYAFPASQGREGIDGIPTERYLAILKEGAKHFNLPMEDLEAQQFQPQRRPFVRLPRPQGNAPHVSNAEFTRMLAESTKCCVFVAFGVCFRSPWGEGEEGIRPMFLNGAIEFQDRMRATFYYPGLGEADYDLFLEDLLMSLCHDRVEAVGF